MQISDSILKNEKLSSEMKIFSDEIDRLQIFRDLFKRKPGEEFGINPRLSGILTRKLNRAKDQFLMLNEDYEEGSGHKIDEMTAAIISEIHFELKEIREAFSKIEFKRF